MVRPWKRKSPQGEMELIGEYVNRQYAGELIMLRLRLGTVAPPAGAESRDEKTLRTLSPFLRFADAIAVTATELIVIEAKMRSDPGAIGQLELYAELVPLTRELEPYLDRRLVKEMVVAIEDPAVSVLARKSGIRVAVYKPAWLPEWQANRHRRQGVPHAPGGLPTS